MPWYDFFWNDEIIEHLAEHGITPEDFEYVVSNPDSEGKSDSSGLPAAWGYTPDGRYVIAVYEKIDDVSIVAATCYVVPEPY